MANAEHLLISKVIQTGSVSEVIEAGLRPDHFTGDYQNMWIWVLDYWRKHQPLVCLNKSLVM